MPRSQRHSFAHGTAPRRLVGVVGIAACSVAILGLAGCANSAAGPTGPSAFANVSGSAVPMADEITALCASIVSQKLAQEAAEALAESSGYVTRVGSIDGTPQPTTKDYREDRMTFDITGGVVTGCVVG